MGGVLKVICWKLKIGSIVSDTVLENKDYGSLNLVGLFTEKIFIY
jgi:hypothetical protein